MSDLPFGFTGGGQDPDRPRRPDDPQDPFAAIFGGGDLGSVFTRLGEMLSWSGGPVNWDLARDLARKTATAGNDRFVGAAQQREVAEALRLAELWLDPVTVFAAGAARTAAWSRSDWIEQTLPAWQQLVDPVAARVVEAMGSALTQQVPSEMSQLGGPLGEMLRAMGGAMFGAQVGQALGSLAGEVVGSTDVGIPLGPAGTAALLPANVAAFGEGLGVPPEEVRVYLALREAAYHRLFSHAPWLRPRVAGEIEAYARGTRIDTSRIEEAIARLDPTNPAALQEALGSNLFQPEETPEQRLALARLEGLLALIEGWVDEVVDAAAVPRLPAAAALRETVRRRRAAGGPAEQTFAALVGLELRPRRLREAAALWRALLEARGLEGRDAVWAHPDLMPSASDLDDPAGFAARTGSGDWDIRALEHPGEDGLGGEPRAGS